MARDKMDLTGQQYGRLTVLSEAPKKGTRRYWTCQCECGTIKNVQQAHLRNGSISSCGCKLREYEDLTGRRFGRLTVIKEGKRVTKEVKNKFKSNPYQNFITERYWVCQCDCGNITEVLSYILTNEGTKSCGCLTVEIGTKNIMKFMSENKKIKYFVGKRFGYYEIIGYTDYKNPIRKLCKCVLCGDEKLLTITSLSKKPTCRRKEHHKRLPKDIDLVGLTFNHLTVIKKSEDKNGKNYWLCKCSCGNEKHVRQDHLIQEKIKSCGCLRNVKKPKVDLTGKRFGRLLAVSPTSERKHGHTVWLCECDCGNTHQVESVYLTSGQTKSCGCLKRNIENVNLREKYDEQRIEGVNTSLLKAKMRSDNKSGVKGVYYHNKTGKWYAQLVVDGKTYRSSTSKNKEDAIRARKELEEKYHKPYLEAKKNDDA